MTIGADEIGPAEVPAGKPNPWQRMVGVLFAPTETFQSIVRRPDVLVPLLVILAVAAVTGIVMATTVDFSVAARESMSAQERFRDASEDQKDRMVRFSAAFWKAAAFSSPITTAILLVIITAVIFFAFRLFGGEGTFKQAFSASLYAWLPMMLKGIIATVVLSLRQEVTFADFQSPILSNPSFLVDMSGQPVLFALLTSFDVFSIWYLILLTIGFAAVSRLSTKTSAFLVGGLWVALIAVKMGFAALQASMSG